MPIQSAHNQTQLLEEQLLCPELLDWIKEAHQKFEPTRQKLLKTRIEIQKQYDAGQLPGPVQHELAHKPDWKVASIPADLQQRRVEITGPINHRKMVINMLSRNQNGVRADAAMLDFEDSMKPTWQHVLQGISNLKGAALGQLQHSENKVNGIKRYQIDAADMPIVMVRVRGLHMQEKHPLPYPVSAGLFDLVSSVFHGVPNLLQRNQTPAFYVPKCESYQEAAWWNACFAFLEEKLSLPQGTLKCTFLIETLPATFQIEEILYELRNRIVALNLGRWDKIFSDIKVLAKHPDRLMADRSTIGYNRSWMMAYAKRLIHMCHKRGALALGGMAAFTPGKSESRIREQTQKVIEDKQLEHSLGCDGCWVSHPFFIGPALQAFPEKNQLSILPQNPQDHELLPQACGPHTMAGLRTNLRVGIAYLHGWFQGLGCIALDDLMEDLATFEISRAQTFQWLKHRVELDDQPITQALIQSVINEECQRLIEETPNPNKSLWQKAAKETQNLFCQENLDPFFKLEEDHA